jgi:hypothetical protein
MTTTPTTPTCRHLCISPPAPISQPAGSEEVTEAEVKATLENSPIAFGLVQQGHIPTIERMLAAGASWKEIGNEIGWMADSAYDHYSKYVQGLPPYRNTNPPTSQPAELSELTTLREENACLQARIKEIEDDPGYPWPQ